MCVPRIFATIFGWRNTVWREFEKFFEQFLRDGLYIVREDFHNFKPIVHKTRRYWEFKNWKSWFQARISKSHSHYYSSIGSEALKAFLFLENFEVNNNEDISVVTADSPTSDENTSNRITDALLPSVSYSSIESVLRQLDKIWNID